jgi:NAD(P)-dependent dehydrogenase (short-subunit alcohol dehydrogenase family)
MRASCKNVSRYTRLPEEGRSMSRLLEGKVALITGGGRGVGRGIALTMAEQGARVVVNDLGASLDGKLDGEQPAQEVVARIKAMGGEAIVDGGSVADWSAANRMVEAAVNAFGRIDIVVNNAGILRDVMFHRMNEIEFDEVLAVHLKGSFNVSRAAAPHFKAQGSGVYVHMTSTSGLIGNFGQANYSAAKLGIVGLSKSIALDMQKFGVRSNAVAPFAWTRMIDSIPADTPEQKKRVDGLKKLVPERVAPFVVGLCADEARDVSGQIFGVRNNEIYLFSQPRPIRNAHAGEGWTPQSVVDTALPMLRAGFFPLDRSGDVFTWDPV